MKRIIFILTISMSSFIHAGAWDCNDNESISDKLDLSFSEHSDNHSFVDDPQKTLIALVIKIPKTIDSYNFVAISALTSEKPRYDFTLLTSEYPWNNVKAHEKSKEHLFTRIVADKDYFNGQNCVIAQYKTATGKIRVEFMPLTLNKAINVNAQQAVPDAAERRPL